MREPKKMSLMERIKKSTSENNAIRAELHKKLVKDPVKYKWEIVIKPHFSFTIAAAVFAILFGGLFIFMGLSDNSAGTILTGVILLPFMFYINRYLLFPNVLTKYKIMPLGIVSIEKDCIPETVFKIIRILAWGGVVTCLLAVFIVGPMAFVGAGGSALMAFQLINAQPVERTHEFYFIGHYKLATLASGGAISFSSGIRNGSGVIHFQKEHAKRINKLLKRYVNITEIIELDNLTKVLNY